MAREIERKFLVNLPPEVPEASGPVRLRQGYLAIDGGVEVRLREADGATTMTIKAGRGVSRTEVEVPLDADDAEALWEHATERSLRKARRRIPLADGFVAELDEYEDALAGLRVVEVEFPDDDVARAFVPPDWFGREVTGEDGWSNADLAQRGAPPSA